MQTLEPEVIDDPVVEGTPIGRRIVLGMLGLGAAGILFGKAAQDRLASVLSPNIAALLPSGGRFRIYSVTGFLPRKSTADYRFALDGMVEGPLAIGFAELTAMKPTSITVDFQCVTGWRVPEVKWKGVKLAELLDAAGVKAGATALRLFSFDGVYTESLT
ncbi:MAG: molybdopterin-dependent oxidoreductase, partial [Actinomycetota bacterium]|nr:molybdopterin-dependent oxidoreductase [Actinomycetota bacterium]